LIAHLSQDESRELDQTEVEVRNALLDGDLVLPAEEQHSLVSAYVPIVLGCSHACTYCIIPYRRGVEISRPVGVIVQEVRRLVEQGVKEITLLGQIVDRYGKDIPDGPNLAQLLKIVAEVDGLKRLRFLTSHPNWMTDELLAVVAENPVIMPHIEVPAQAGNDDVLANMKREYTNADYRKLIAKIRQMIPNVSIGTDIIVGFPGETDEQFMDTYNLLEDLRLDVAHLARYSTRPGTVADRRMEDDVTDEEKWRRFRMLEDQQARIVGELNAKLLGETVPVLFEDKVKDRWRGRTENTKLVFVETEEDLTGQVRDVRITWTGPWSMQADIRS
jgi:tRNA-2-methylthio-N6-dimethylallyladenosine synthase